MQEEKGKFLKILGTVIAAVAVIEAVFWGNYYFMNNKSSFPGAYSTNSGVDNVVKIRTALEAINANTKVAMNGKIVNRTAGVIEVQGLLDNSAAKKKFDLSAAKFYNAVKSGALSSKTVFVDLKETPELFSKIKVGSNVSVTFLEANKNDDTILAVTVVVVSL